MTNAERYLALMRLAAHHGEVTISWCDYSDPGERPALEWSVLSLGPDGAMRALGLGRSLDEAVDEASRAHDARPIEAAS